MQSAWRWLMLNESEIESKMAPIMAEHAESDPELYHKVKMCEMAKMEDMFNDQFQSTNYRYFIHHY